ncbi:Alpha-ribazole-5'-phosphate phosphatase (EC 3.1.3.73) [uncultured Gammaproteobacteria bacterium]|uniref:histidine phosphatase family protein n=1 Tax=Bathymodiolus heckerae thiotrophic gill symbiont TaxID=1052212 RepID=UPI0010BC90A7|nr:histidine phosphatase family protein [Bathymodiolus heckerae thiotrophic gill symbiont]CAC9579723.1 Alpha-ribazole-5'-phosphate phosphatase (EC 3.1.3.73) [uncultured Gammaproteobacteria bacterium]CAC9607492.1 Alpha-ribazole-5'-phosphate phosphatase (EC 3.1.3.73) [uncultured Gammaproteobacteria bacterium]CAC9958405.1 Alpha-ribazole-5'-phosphate phosphatase (EC 3.1.3.73) [uncultured Gammaproteobacteria bacterium]SHN89458.1 Alpha-ribazole-5'-phosphate phosphatase [Bathymodiolus heckerae thiotro
MKLSLLRHGEPVGGRIYRGDQDDPLTDKGWQQMLDSTKDQSWSLIASSPLVRCQTFAKYLQTKQQSQLEIINDFKELGFGDWQGLSATVIGQDLVDSFKQNPIDNRPPNAENLYEFQKRVISAFNSVITSNTDSLLIVAHAGVIRVIKSHLLNLPIEKMFTIEIMNASCENFEI